MQSHQVLDYSYHKYIDNWLRKVEDNKIPACKEQKALTKFIRKILDDQNTEIRHKTIDEGVEMLHRWFPFKMHDFQLFRFALLYGLFEKGTEFPIFSECFNLWGRGTGKNGIASMDAFYMVSDYNGVKDYLVEFVANSEKQATTSFNEVRDIILNDINLSQIFSVTKKEIICKPTRGKISYMTSNPKTKEGGRHGAIVYDEVHMYQDYELMKTLEGGFGKVDKPKTIYLTTDGFVRESVLDDLKERSWRVFNGEEPYNGFLPFIFKMDDIKQVEDEELWQMAIPRLPYSETLKREVRKEYYKALYNPSLMESFITKRMNLPFIVKSRAVATSEEILRASKKEWPDLTGQDCIGAIDFADRLDFASVGLRFKFGSKHYFMQHSFIHERALKNAKYKIDLNRCIVDGFATLVCESEAPTIPAELLVEWFIEKAKNYNIRQINADLFRINLIKSAFKKVGIEVKPVRNGSITHNKIVPVIQHLFTEDNIALEDDRLMRWYISNVKVEIDKKGNKTFHKIEPVRRKTDGFFCLSHTFVDDVLEEPIKPFIGVISF